MNSLYQQAKQLAYTHYLLQNGNSQIVVPGIKYLFNKSKYAACKMLAIITIKKK